MDATPFIKEAKEKSKKRNFKQSIDLCINVKGVDLKKPENKFKEEVILPHTKGNGSKVGVIGTLLITKAKDKADILIDVNELATLEANKRKAKKLIEEVDFFIAEPELMARIGRTLGRILGPRNKMPKPFPGQADPAPLINRLKKSVIIELRDNPVVQCSVGTEGMNDEQINENVNVVINAVENKLPNKMHNIKSILVKTTMGPSIKIK